MSDLFGYRKPIKANRPLTFRDCHIGDFVFIVSKGGEVAKYPVSKTSYSTYKQNARTIYGNHQNIDPELEVKTCKEKVEVLPRHPQAQGLKLVIVFKNKEL